MKKKIVLFAFIASVVAILYGHHQGEARVDGFNGTGSGGGSGCGNCHASATTNGTKVELDSAGIAVTSYRPGGSYTVKISATNSSATSLPRYGFQLTTVKATGAGTTSAVDAGIWGTMPASVQKTLPATSGLSHTIIEQSTQILATTGTGGNGTTYVQSIPWTAPVVGTGSVVIYGVINAVNNAGNSSGDKYQVATPVTITEAAAVAGVSIALTSGTNPACAGASLTFTASPSNGGAAPTYQWKINGNVVSTINPFTTNGITNGQVVSCVMTSNLSGITGNPATSNNITVTVNPVVTPTVAITPSATTICAGANVSFTSSNTNPGAAPIYQWKKNGININGQTAATFASTTLINGDIITLAMTSNATCASPATVTSQQQAITVNPLVTPTVNIVPSATTICTGGNVSFTSSNTNAGTPTYQWKKNGGNLNGQTGSIFSSTALQNADVISLEMTSTANCASPTTVTSATQTITVNPLVTPTVTIVPSATTICAGGNLSFTSSNANPGNAPIYQWKKNGANIGGQTNSTYATTTLVNGDIISLDMTSNAACTTVSNVTSNRDTVVVNPLVAPTIAITPSANTICAGGNVSFASTNTNAGANPAYQWKKNGTNIGGQTSSTFSSTTLANGDIITLAMTSNATCASPATVTSAADTIRVNPVVVPQVSISSNGGNTICTGQSVVFTATPVNGGTPAYQWKRNSINLQSATGSTYITDSLVDGDAITVQLTSNALCASPTVVISSAINISIITNGVPLVSITSNSGDSICAGESVTFTATPVNGGSAPTYQWLNRGNTINGEVSSTYTSSSLADGDAITVDMVSNSQCVISTSASSNAIPLTVSAISNTSVTITNSASDSICNGQTLVFTANPVNGGTNPLYQWKKNNVAINGEIANTFTSALFADNDLISVELTSNALCAYPAVAVANNVVVTVFPLPTVTITRNNDSLNATSALTYQWFIDNNIINGAVSQNIKPSGAGNYTVSITDVHGCSSTSSPFAFIPTGIQNLSSLQSISTYPNPSEGNIIVDLGTSISTSAIVVRVLDYTGKTVVETKEASLEQKLPLNLNTLPDGIYMIQISRGEEVGYKRVVISKR